MRAGGIGPSGLLRGLVDAQIRQLAEPGKRKDGKQRERPHIGEQARQRADDLVGEIGERQMDLGGVAAVPASGDCIHGLQAGSNVVLRPVLA